eukprot:10032870-Karenia_brevis.AAC.1
MRKTYRQVTEEMRSNPSPHVLSAIDELDEIMSTVRRDFDVGGASDRVRLINRSRADALNKSFVDWRYQT